MATRKSSITAELKLTGQATFKSGLKDIEGAAANTSKKLSVLGNEGFGSKRQFTVAEERHRAHRRVIERQEKESAARIAAYEKAGIRMGGRGGAAGGRFNAAAGGTRNAGMAYNFAQDYIQGGGIRGIANNIPQMAEALIGSPAFAAITATALAAAAAGWTGFQLYQSTGSRFEEGAGNRYATNKAAGNKVSRQRAQDEAMQKAGLRGDNASAFQSGYGKNIDGDISRLGAGADAASAQREHAAEMRRIEIEGIEDPSAKAVAAAEEEKRVLDENLKARRQQAEEVMRIAAAEKEASEAKFRDMRQEIQLMKGISLKREELERKAQIEKEIGGVKIRAAEAQERAAKAGQGIEDLKSLEKATESKKKEIDAGLAAKQKEIKRERDASEAEGRQAWNQTRDEFANRKKEADKQIAEEKKNRESTINAHNEDFAMSRMSPRKRAKAEEARALKNDTDELIKQGIDPETAKRMAGEKASMRKPDNGRIKGAGYKGDDSKRRSGLGSASYDGLAGLAAMQDDMVSPSAPEGRKRIKGAGSKKEAGDQEKQQGDSAKGIWNQILAGLKSVEKAVRDTGPSSNDRAKPISTTNR